MRLFSIQTVAYLAALSPLAGVFASPTDRRTGPPGIYESYELEARAPPILLDLQPITNAPATFSAILVNKIAVFKAPYTDTQILDAAKEAFDHWDTKQQKNHQFGKSLLVAVIGIPGYGLAAGTIWHDNDVAFETLLQENAPKLRALTKSLNVKEGSTASKWHAEIVALWVAETAFPNAKDSGNNWPAGTRIAAYGREQKKDKEGKVELVSGYKPVCGRERGTSTNTRSCSTLLTVQNVDIINLDNYCVNQI
jgi:hypothetical protein